MAKFLAALFLSLAALPAQAADQTYKVLLGGIELGWFRFSGGPNDARISSQFNNTPLGVFDGSYEGRSRTRAGGTQYDGKSVSTTKNRAVEIVRDKVGRVTEMNIAPPADQTAYSNPAQVPAGVLDPVAGFAQFLGQNECPAAFKLYDGRRVVQVTPKSSSVDGAVRICVSDYHVMLGKGHLSPLYIKNITVTVTFDPSIAKTGPALLRLQSGIFGVEFRRD